MTRLICFITLCIVLPAAGQQNDDAPTWHFTIRCGQGGFSDSRSDLNQLGGGQIALDISHKHFPVTISYVEEYYTNSAEPTHVYEIAGLACINFLYKAHFDSAQKWSWFAGGGPGMLSITKSDAHVDDYYYSGLFNIEAGSNYRFWKGLGFYGIAKYLYAYEDSNPERIIDFNEFIFMIGLTLSFSF